jgi:Fe-S-cluster containining protein
MFTMPITLECHRCTACCRWPGEVRLEAEEISKIAALKNMAEADFIERHMRLRQDRRGLALKENPDGSCIFLENGGCAVQAAKPQQCQDFPNRWVNQLWGKMPPDEMRRDYPMLFNCAAFKAFLNTDKA